MPLMDSDAEEKEEETKLILSGSESLPEEDSSRLLFLPLSVPLLSGRLVFVEAVLVRVCLAGLLGVGVLLDEGILFAVSRLIAGGVS